MNSVLTHAGRCGGSIYPEVSTLFSIRTPSVIITPKGLGLGPLEISYKTSGGTIELKCSKCDEIIEQENYDKEILIECSICHEKHPAKKVYTSRTISIFCDDCRKYLIGEKPAPEHIQTILKFLILPAESTIKCLTEVLTSKVSL